MVTKHNDDVIITSAIQETLQEWVKDNSLTQKERSTLKGLLRLVGRYETINERFEILALPVFRKDEHQSIEDLVLSLRQIPRPKIPTGTINKAIVEQVVRLNGKIEKRREQASYEA